MPAEDFYEQVLIAPELQMADGMSLLMESQE